MYMDNVQSVLTILLAVELFIITVCIAFASYFLIKTLKSISQTAESFGRMKTLIPIPALLVAILSKIFKKRG